MPSVTYTLLQQFKRQYLNDALVILGVPKMVPHYRLQTFSGGNKGSLNKGSSVIVNLVRVIASLSLISTVFQAGAPPLV